MADLKPLLRPLRLIPFTYRDTPGFLLQDPLRLSPHVLFVPADLAPVLALMDGTHTPQAMRAAMLVRYGVPLPPEVLDRLIQDLDQAYFLENDRFRAYQARRLASYRAGPYREPSHAGEVYPKEPEALRAQMDTYLRTVLAHEKLAGPVVGVVSPHIDYARGHRVYAAAWSLAREALQRAERVIVLATDHNAPPGAITLTRQSYATPYGVLPTAQDVVDRLAAALGEEEAFRHEVHHIGEHAAELALVWAHHLRDGRAVDVVPILLGGLDHYFGSGRHPREDVAWSRVADILRAAVDEKPTVVVAAVDLAHVGPAFGDPAPWNDADKARLRAADETLLAAIRAGQPDAFYEAVAATRDRYRICGFGPLYMYLRVLEGLPTHIAAYEHAPADDQFGSVVSIAGGVTWVPRPASAEEETS
ncbi:MAG: AmmeMemoRadiSam system protein B [Chloroflexi bacterium]|nr:AmmeMemoRadiSam system protein B [Chloroflexota bacterium]